MIDGKPETPGEAIGTRLLTDDVLKTVVGERINPNLPVQEVEPIRPYLVFFRVSGGGENTLDGRSGLQRYYYRVEFYADTDEECESIRELVLNRLCGNSRKGIAPWVDKANGIHCCFAAEDADTETLQDGSLVSGQTVSLWFCPQV